MKFDSIGSAKTVTRSGAHLQAQHEGRAKDFRAENVGGAA